jgi:hypothetical protein
MGSLAQWLERLFSKEKVGGSSPPWASFIPLAHNRSGYRMETVLVCIWAYSPRGSMEEHLATDEEVAGSIPAAGVIFDCVRRRTQAVTGLAC